MKLLRVGDLGHEKVAALDDNNIMRDLSSHIEDLNPETINFDNLKKLKQLILKGSHLEVEAEYKKLLDIRPFHPEAMLQLIDYYLEHNKLNKAAKYTTELLNITPFWSLVKKLAESFDQEFLVKNKDNTSLNEKISFCLIAKNEQENIGRCLNSLNEIQNKQIIVVDTDPVKRENARSNGARYCFSPEEMLENLNDFNGKIAGVIDFVGNEKTANLALSIVKKGGTIVIVGLYGGSLSISLPLIPMRSINIKGSYVGELRELKELVELINSKNVELIKVTKQDLNTANDAMKKLRNGDVDGRIVLEP